MKSRGHWLSAVDSYWLTTPFNWDVTISIIIPCITWLVVLEHEFYEFPFSWESWSQLDFQIFQRGQPPTSVPWHCHSGTTHQLFVRCFQRISGISGRDIKLENIMLARVRRGDIFAPRRWLDSSQHDVSKAACFFTSRLKFQHLRSSLWAWL